MFLWLTNLKASKEKCAFWSSPFISITVCGSRVHLGWKSQSYKALRSQCKSYYCNLHSWQRADSPHEKVIVGAVCGKRQRCCVASVEQHMEPSRRGRRVFRKNLIQYCDIYIYSLMTKTYVFQYLSVRLVALTATKILVFRLSPVSGTMSASV